MKRMSDYNWDQVAKGMVQHGWLPPLKIINKGKVVIFMFDAGKRLEFHDNGGEINIVEKTEKHYPNSVPFWDNTQSGGAINDLTLGYRLTMELRGQRINYNKHIVSRVASRFLEASRANRTSWLLAGQGYGAVHDFEITAKDFKGLYKQLTDVIHEGHSWGNGAFDFQFKRGAVDRTGDITMEYVFLDGHNKALKYDISLTLYAENARERSSELAKPIDIVAFKKFLEGKYFGDTPYDHGDRVR